MTLAYKRRIEVSPKRGYAKGYKYCSRCRLYILTDRVRCPYCGVILRNSPRKKYRRAGKVKAVEIPPDLEKELEKIEVKVKVKHRSG